MKFLTIKQAAELANVSTRTVRRWIDDKQLSYVAFGGSLKKRGCIRISKENLDRYTSERTFQAIG
jgi:excisionase family DNA binding protein